MKTTIAILFVIALSKACGSAVSNPPEVPYHTEQGCAQAQSDYESDYLEEFGTLEGSDPEKHVWDSVKQVCVETYGVEG